MFGGPDSFEFSPLQAHQESHAALPNFPSSSAVVTSQQMFSVVVPLLFRPPGLLPVLRARIIERRGASHACRANQLCLL